MKSELKSEVLVKYLYLFLTIILATISALFGINNQIELCFIFSVIGFIIMAIGIKDILRSYSNVTLAYIFFMFLYTYSGVFSVIWGDGLHRIFSSNYQPLVFIILSNIAFCSLHIGFLFSYKNLNCKNQIELDVNNQIDISRILNKAILLAWIAFSMEFINFIRVGGFSAVALGKAYYNSKVSQLVITLPGALMVTISVVYFALYLGHKRLKKIKKINLNILWFIVPISSVLLVYTLLGRRGSFVSIAIIMIVGSYYFKPIKRIPAKILIFGVVLYLMLSILYSVRAHIGFYVFEQNDISGLIQMITDKDRIINAIIPSQNEFGVAFGNFNEYYISSVDKALKWGESYLKGFLILIPSWLFPGEKPLQIVYEFRNIYFPSEATRGSIASTGFSFLLEAFMNFRIFGVALVYFLVGVVLAKLEKYRLNKSNSLFFQTFYLSFIAVIGIFQRNAFGDIFSSIIMYTVILLIFNFKFKKVKHSKTSI